MKITLRQYKSGPEQAKLDKIMNWIMVFHQEIPESLPYAAVLEARRKRLSEQQTSLSLLICDLPNQSNSHVAYACVDTNLSVFQLLTLARKLVAAHAGYDPRTLGLFVAGFSEQLTEKIGEALIAAVLAANATMPDFSCKPKRRPSITHIHVYGLGKICQFERTFAEAEGNALARSLSMLPANKLTPADYLKEVKQLAKANRWQLQFYGSKQLKQKKAGAFLAVAQGSPTDDAGIIRLQYKPKPGRAKLILVGKGICYDTGGTNLKPANHMYGMHEDMQGSAVALGTFMALTRLQVQYPVECWLALAMNHIGPEAYKQNDVVTAADGTTIEIVHTDAEGRMILADALTLAAKLKPKYLIDYATLTGACIHALGKAYSGVFTNEVSLISSLLAAGQDSGERVWPFPLDEDFDSALESNIADLKQCAEESGPDHIQAARFLRHFVKDAITWIHLDLSASHCKGGLAHIPTDTTGFGVRFTLNLLLDKKII